MLVSQARVALMRGEIGYRPLQERSGKSDRSFTFFGLQDTGGGLVSKILAYSLHFRANNLLILQN